MYLRANINTQIFDATDCIMALEQVANNLTSKTILINNYDSDWGHLTLLHSPLFHHFQDLK